MQAHHVIEGMGETERCLDMRGAGADMDLWTVIKARLATAVNIDKGAMAIPPEMVQFGRDLIMSNLFQLPFPDIFLVPSGPGNAGILAFDNNGSIGVVACEPTAIAKTIAPIVMPTTWMFAHPPSEGDHVHAGHEKDVHGMSGAILPQLEKIMGNDGVWERGFYALDIVLGMTAMLGSKFTRTTVREAPTTLNLKRAKRGRPSIGRTIVVSMVDTAMRADGVDQQKASPVPHWRRGHLRRLPDGRIVPIAPSLVAWSSDWAMPTPKDYVVH